MSDIFTGKMTLKICQSFFCWLTSFFQKKKKERNHWRKWMSVSSWKVLWRDVMAVISSIFMDTFRKYILQVTLSYLLRPKIHRYTVLCRCHIFLWNEPPFFSILFKHKADMPQTLALPAPFSRPDTVECWATTPVEGFLESASAWQTRGTVVGCVYSTWPEGSCYCFSPHVTCAYLGVNLNQ